MKQIYLITVLYFFVSIAKAQCPDVSMETANSFCMYLRWTSGPPPSPLPASITKSTPAPATVFNYVSGAGTNADPAIYKSGGGGGACNASNQDFTGSIMIGSQICFYNLSVLPVSFTSFSLSQQGNGMALEWQVATQQNIVRYIIERSTDGVHFTTIATKQVNTAETKYEWVDNNPGLYSKLSYRVTAVDITGKQLSSRILMGNTANRFAVEILPNPVINKQLTLAFSRAKKGIYDLQIVDYAGQSVFKRSIQLTDGMNTRSFELPFLAKGIYYLKIDGAEGKVFSKPVSVL